MGSLYVFLLNSGVSVRSSVYIRTSVHKKFLRFRSNVVYGWTSTEYAQPCDLDPIQGQSQGHGASEFPKLLLFKVYHLRKSARTSKLMADCGGMGPILQPREARFLNFLLSKLSRDFKLPKMSTLYDIQRTYFPTA